MNNRIVIQDLNEIFSSLTQSQKDFFKNSNILITGCAGFLGFYLLHFFMRFSKELGIKKVIGLDNFMLRLPEWLQVLQNEYPQNLEISKFDVIKDKIADLNAAQHVDIIIHMASVASPVFYRQYPIETLDANIWGLRNLLNFYSEKTIKGFLFFSSSEIYGDPTPQYIPTPETYRGNVACIGPRACYDESKRFGETMCYLFAQKYLLPTTIVRPFNNYGPGMNLEDKRVPADFAQAVLNNEDIKILSDGSPKRTFCYISDAISGYLKALSYGKFDVFNIGIDRLEISIKELAIIYQKMGKKVWDYTGKITLSAPKEKEYLIDNPIRRSPLIDKAKSLLDYNPKVLVEEGVERFLKFLSEENKRI